MGFYPEDEKLRAASAAFFVCRSGGLRRGSEGVEAQERPAMQGGSLINRIASLTDAGAESGNLTAAAQRSLRAFHKARTRRAGLRPRQASAYTKIA
jgi:hypothetical protein